MTSLARLLGLLPGKRLMARLTDRIRSPWLLAGLVAVSLTLFPTITNAQSQTKGDGSLRIEYQYIGTGAFDAEILEFDYWQTDTHAAVISADYALSDRLTVYAALPYVQKRFVPTGPDIFGTGPGDPHNPNGDYWIDFVPPDKRFHDDGDYHGGFQDLSFGLMYRIVDSPSWTVSPYIGYAAAVTDYPIFAKAAIGANLWNVPVGINLGYIPYFSDWHFRGNVAYVFSEEPLGINVDYWLAYLSAGYWFKPNLSVNLFLSSKYLTSGLNLLTDFSETPLDYPDSYDTERWWQHDRLLRHRLLNLGIGFDYFLNEKYQVSASYFQGVWAEQTTEVDNAFSLALTYYFGNN